MQTLIRVQHRSAREAATHAHAYISKLNTCLEFETGSNTALRAWAIATARVAATGRRWGHVLACHPGLKLIDVYAALIPSLEFIPGLHVNYAETVLPIKAGLLKLKVFPSEFGGSGEIIPEQEHVLAEQRSGR